MGRTTPHAELDDILARSERPQQDDCAMETEEQVIDLILRAAFVLRGILPVLEESMDIPATVHAAMTAYDDASWDCTSSDPYGGEKHQALVETASRFIASIGDLEEQDSH